MRSRFIETRLAVTLAMQPLAKRRRALAMSTRGVSTGTPTASTLSTSDGDEALDDVEIVDHEIADHVDVGAAVDERCEAVALEEARLGDHGWRRAERRVEALEVPDLQDAAARVGGANERLTLRGGRRERLFDQDVDAGGEEIAADRGMRARRHRDARAVDGARRAPDGRRRRSRRARRRPRARGRGRGRRRRRGVTPSRAAYFSAWNRPRCPTPTTAARSRGFDVPPFPNARRRTTTVRKRPSRAATPGIGVACGRWRTFAVREEDSS